MQVNVLTGRKKCEKESAEQTQVQKECEKESAEQTQVQKECEKESRI
jgi:hypothetical protein